jgi:hypothetical protein
MPEVTTAARKLNVGQKCPCFERVVQKLEDGQSVISVARWLASLKPGECW